MIQLTALHYDKPLWINPSLITSFESYEGGTIIYFDDSNDVKVKEKPEEVCALCPPPRLLTEDRI
jgi:uncharacterized protein YlzI (FlbEa/FlbD family)